MLEVRDGEKGVIVRKLATCSVFAHTERGRKDACEELLIVTERPDGAGVKYDYSLSNAFPLIVFVVQWGRLGTMKKNERNQFT